MNNLDPAKLVEHVNDANGFELPLGWEIRLPSVLGFQITKFMVLELLAAALIVALFVPLARKLSGGQPAKGRLANLLEMLVLFIRNEVVRPAIGRHDADRFLPLILSLFFFIFVCNLMGLIPCMGSPTASINVTAPLAVVTFLIGIGSGMRRHGALGFWTGLCPPMDLPPVLRIVFVPLILVLEIVGMFIRYGVLAVRLLANMFGGHLVLAIILAFIPAMAGSLLWYGVTPTAVFGSVFISLLELLFAFIQAYIFAFLGALFIGMALHQH
jgi:F-type H+-transporting ATPase subunit a